MKPITINITPEILEKYTVDSSAVSGLKYKGVDVKSCTVPHHLSGFPQTAVKILELFHRGVAGADFRTIQRDKDKFATLSVKGNSDNTDMFSVFRKFGIVTGNLSIGVTGGALHPTLYTTSKLLKDISRYSVDVQAGLVFTLFNISKVCTKVITKVPNITYSTVSDIVDAEIPLNDLLIDFSTIKDITVMEMPTEEYVGLTYHNNKYCVGNTTYTSPLEYGLLAASTDAGPVFDTALVLVAASFGKTVYPVLVTPSGDVYTTMELSSFESARDSVISAVSAKYTGAVKVHRTDVETLLTKIPEGYKFVDIIEDVDNEEAFEASSNTLVAWHKAVPNKASVGHESRTTLMTMLHIKDGSAPTLDKTSMEAMYADDEYAQQLYKQVKPYYDTFDLGTIAANLRGFAKGDLYSMLFIGSSGTGKSTSARVLPARCGIPYISVNFSVNIEESDIVGTMIPNVAKASADDPEFVWQDGVLTKAVRNGYCVILEEINFARPGVLGKLNSLLDENRQLDLPTGEVLIAHPNFRIIATCNVAYEGTNRFNKALINRFEDCTIFKDVTRAKAIEIIKNRTGYKNMSKIDPILNVYDALKKYSKEQNLNLVVSMRQLLTIFSNGKYYSDAKDAVVRIMVNGAFIEEPEYQDEFEKSVLPAFKLNYKL